MSEYKGVPSSTTDTKGAKRLLLLSLALASSSDSGSWGLNCFPVRQLPLLSYLVQGFESLLQLRFINVLDFANRHTPWRRLGGGDPGVEVSVMTSRNAACFLSSWSRQSLSPSQNAQWHHRALLPVAHVR